MVAQRIEEIAASLDLVELLDRQTGKLSGGQKRRLHTAIALLHRPKLLLLDEATSGADVETRARLLDLVRQLADEGSAVLYSTHYLQEVEELNANVVILDRGEVIARGAVIDLLARHAQPVVEFVFAGAVPPGAIDASIADYRIEGPRLRVPTSEPASVIAGVANRVPSGQLSSVEILRPSLETVYLAYAGRRYDEADKEVNVVTPV
jgi:ABC-2 type transport system ATP-binding protein